VQGHRGIGALLPDAWKERYEDARGALRERRRPARDPRFFTEVDPAQLGARGSRDTSSGS
jgi:hypothetical protein